MTQAPQSPGDWGDQNTGVFVDIGRYAVPEREWQIAMFCDLIPPRSTPFTIVELCCGEGLLAEALLARFPYANLLALDGSPAMLEHTTRRLHSYAGRVTTRQFDLAGHEWRTSVGDAWAVVSSLAIHHLDGSQKQRLFRDVYAMLEPGGVFVIADVIKPADQRGMRVAAEGWDRAVARRGRELDGDADTALAAFERARWNMYRYPDEDSDEIDKPSTLLDQLDWLRDAGFAGVDVYWMQAGHALFGGQVMGKYSSAR